jgi:hypothetical protein
MTARIRLVLAGGLTLTVVAVCVVLVHHPSVVVATNGVPANLGLAQIEQDATVCQDEEALPAGASAVRIALNATIGAPVSVRVLTSGGALITSGDKESGWYGSAVTAPVKPIARAVPDVTVCFTLSELTGEVVPLGEPTSPALAATRDGISLPGRVAISYLRPDKRSWWSQAGAVLRHMGLGRAWSGAWIVLPIVALMLAAIAAGSWLIARDLR